jgi:transcriptional regulator GlxA family with amidase domain
MKSTFARAGRRALLAGLSFVVLTVTWAAEKKLTPPAGEPLRVAFVISNGANVIDHAGPWEVFQDTGRPDGRGPAFRLYTVSDETNPIRATAGLLIVPHYTFENAPEPHIVVIGAQGGNSPAMKSWLTRQAGRADVVLSVCTGAVKLAALGLLDGKTAATHHDFVDSFNQRFPQVKFVAGKRFVQVDDTIITAGGLTSGIDAALHVVARYFGSDTAARVAAYMEYESDGWRSE